LDSKARSTLATTTKPAGKVNKRSNVPAGREFLIRMIDSIDHQQQKTGDRFTASLETNLQAEDVVVAPRGSNGPRQFGNKHRPRQDVWKLALTLELTHTSSMHGLSVLTSTYEIKGKGEGKKTAGKVVGGAGLGALIRRYCRGRSRCVVGRARRSCWWEQPWPLSKKGEQLQITSESLLGSGLSNPHHCRRVT